MKQLNRLFLCLVFVILMNSLEEIIDSKRAPMFFKADTWKQGQTTVQLVVHLSVYLLSSMLTNDENHLLCHLLERTPISKLIHPRPSQNQKLSRNIMG